VLRSVSTTGSRRKNPMAMEVTRRPEPVVPENGGPRGGAAAGAPARAGHGGSARGYLGGGPRPGRPGVRWGEGPTWGRRHRHVQLLEGQQRKELQAQPTCGGG